MSSKKSRYICLHLRNVEKVHIAVIPGDGYELHERVIHCLDCGAFFPASADLEATAAVVAADVHCRGCGIALTQPYAKKMGECIECCLRRIRGPQEQVFWSKKSKRNAALVAANG